MFLFNKNKPTEETKKQTITIPHILDQKDPRVEKKGEYTTEIPEYHHVYRLYIRLDAERKLVGNQPIFEFCLSFHFDSLFGFGAPKSRRLETAASVKTNLLIKNTGGCRVCARRRSSIKLYGSIVEADQLNIDVSLVRDKEDPYSHPIPDIDCAKKYVEFLETLGWVDDLTLNKFKSDSFKVKIVN